MTDTHRHNEPVTREDQPRLEPEAVKDLEVSEQLADEVKGGQRPGQLYTAASHQDACCA